MIKRKVSSEEIIDCLVSHFKQRVEADNKEGGFISKDEDGDYHWKWVYTQAVSKNLGISDSSARYKLSKLEKEGLVVAHRTKRGDKNVLYFGWCASKIEGFVEHKSFRDYRTKLNK